MRRQALLNRLDPQDAGYGLFFEPGAGKSATAINIWRSLCNERKQFLRTLIFCPPIVVPNWKEEFRLNSKIDPGKIVLLNGPGTRRLKLFTSNPGPRIFVTNYETLLMEPLYKAMLEWQPEAIIFDESHRLKNPSAKRSKLAERLANRGPVIPYKQILSGSPVLKDPMDLFMQFLILDGGRTFGGNFFVFRARFFRDRNAGMPKQKYFPKWEPMTLQKDGFDALTEINLRLQSRAMAVKKSECMDLPPFIRQVVKVGMTPDQCRIYNEMKKDFIAVVNDKACTAQLAITKALRLQQIASGYIKTVEGEEIPLEGTPKMDALQELLEEITPTGKVLVWAVWKSNYTQIKQVLDKLELKYVEVTGEVSASKKQEAVKAFNENPEVRVLLGNPGAGGIGINLVSAAYSIFYSRTFSLEHSIQAEARNYRGGSEVHEKITRYDLVCENTIDELISEKLALKIEVGEALIRDLSQELMNQE